MNNIKIKTRGEAAFVTVAVVVVIAILNFASTRAFFRLDLTENKQFTVSNATRKILRELDDIVTVNAFFSRNLPPEVHLTVTATRDILAEYQNIAGGRLRVVWEDPAANPDIASRAHALGVPDITLQTVNRDKVETMRGHMGIAISYAGNTEVIPIVQDLANLEYDLTRSIMRVTQTELPTIGVLMTQSADDIPQQFLAQMGRAGESTVDKFAPIFQIFREDYNVIPVDVSDGSPVDSAVRTLIVPSGDRVDDRTLFEVDQFFMNGGNVIFIADGVNIEFGQFGPNAVISESKLFDLFEHYGVRVERNLIMDEWSGHVQVPRNLGFITMHELRPYPYFIRIVGDGLAPDNPAVSSLSELMLFWASSLTLLEESLNMHGAEANVLVSSSEFSWAVTENFQLEPQEFYDNKNEVLEPHALAYHISGNFISYFKDKEMPAVRRDDEETSALSQINLAADSDREIVPQNTNGNIVIVGDADFITSQQMQRRIGPGAFFMMNIVDWMTLDDNLIEIRSRAVSNRMINPNILEPGSSTPGVIRWFNLLFMPVIVALIGIYISMRRREAASAPAQTNANANAANVSGGAGA